MSKREWWQKEDGSLDEEASLRRRRLFEFERLNRETAHPLAQKVEQLEKGMIKEIYELTQGNKEKTAYLLGVGLATLYRKLKKYGIEYEALPMRVEPTEKEKKYNADEAWKAALKQVRAINPVAYDSGLDFISEKVTRVPKNQK